MKTLIEAAQTGKADADQPEEYVQFVRDALGDGWIPAFGDDVHQTALFAELMDKHSRLNMSVSIMGPPSAYFIRVVRPTYGLTDLIKPPYDSRTVGANLKKIR